MMIARINKNRQARKAACNRRHKILSGLLGAVILTSVSACQLERFRHEKYLCHSPSLNLDEITVNKTAVGDTVTVTTPRGNEQGTITEATENELQINFAGHPIHINRQDAVITIFKNKRYARIKCKKTVFTM